MMNPIAKYVSQLDTINRQFLGPLRDAQQMTESIRRCHEDMQQRLAWSMYPFHTSRAKSPKTSQSLSPKDQRIRQLERRVSELEREVSEKDHVLRAYAHVEEWGL